MTKPFLSKKVNTPLGIPTGFCTAQKAAQMLGMALKDFKAKVELGIFSPPEAVPMLDESGYRLREYFRISEIEKHIQKRPEQNTKRLSPEAIALLKRLKANSKNGFVDGDATDIIHGNPMSKRDTNAIKEIVSGGYAILSRDNWGRWTYNITDKKWSDK